MCFIHKIYQYYYGNYNKNEYDKKNINLSSIKIRIYKKIFIYPDSYFEKKDTINNVNDINSIIQNMKEFGELD